MRILIVHPDNIEASKLKLVFAKYGACTIAPGGKEAVDMYTKSHQQGAPFGLISLEAAMEGVTGVQAAVEIRKWETEHQKEPPVTLILEMAEAEIPNAPPELQAGGVRFMAKPYNRKKLMTLLDELGLSKAPPPAPAPAQPAAPAAPAVKQKNPEAEKAVKQLNGLLNNPEKFQSINAGQVLAELVKKGGKEVELLIGQYITSYKLSPQIRIDLIRAAGQVRSPLFLVPLNRVVDTEDTIKMIEEALIAIGKYGDQRALNIFNNALKKIKNPMLLNTLRREIDRIKQDKPVLAILPRFLASHKSLKNFRVTMDILKKILTPDDTGLFINYLKSGNQVLEDGSFELLCFAGDASIKTTVFNFFEDRVSRSECLAKKECDELYHSTSHLFRYLQRNPQLIEEQVNDLIEFYPTVMDIRVKQTVIAILCRSTRTETLAFIKTIYSGEEELREWIIEKLSGNQEAVDFLFEKYHAGKELKEKVIKSLLKSKEGLEYFIKHFFTFELDKQEVIIKNLTFSDEPFFIDFIRKIYETQLFSLKSYLMGVIKENYMFAFKDLLFDPDNQREFMFMGKDYVETILRLFPLTAVKDLYAKIARTDISTTKMKKYLAWISRVAAMEPVIYFNDPKLPVDLFNRVMKANNIELSCNFFSSFENMKVMHLSTYKFLQDAISAFLENRGANITENERGIVTKLKQRLIDQFPDIRDTENMYKGLKGIMANKPIETEQLEKFIKANTLGIAMHIEKVCKYLAPRLRRGEYISNDERQVFLMQYPMLARFMDHLWETGSNAVEEWENIKPDGKLLKHFRKDLRLVFAFNNKHLTAILKDQLSEILPHFQMILDADPETLKESDILFCDPRGIKPFMDKKAISKHRVFLYLENRTDYAQFRDLKPRAFMKPFSAHRVVRMVLQDLYFPK